MSTRKRILILGGNRYNTPSIQMAREAGFFTIVADRNPQAPGLACADLGLSIDLVDVPRLIEAAQHCGGIDGVISMAEVGVRPAATISHQLDLPSITEEAAANSTSKAAMRRLWANLGGCSVDYRIVDTEEEAFKAAVELNCFPLIFKPDRSLGGSRGVSEVHNPDDIHAAFGFAKSGGLPGSTVVIEPFIPSLSEHSAEVLIWEGRTSVLCVGQKVKSPHPYRVDISVQYPAPLSETQYELVNELCQQAILALGITQGVAHVEFAYTPDGPVLFELGARCGGGHTPQIAHHVSGVNEFIEACRMACGLPPQQFYPTQQCGADYRFLVYQAGTIADICIPDKVRYHPGIYDVAITMRPGDTIHPLHTTSDRAGFAVCLEKTYAEAVALGEWAQAEVKILYE